MAGGGWGGFGRRGGCSDGVPRTELIDADTDSYVAISRATFSSLCVCVQGLK